MKRTGCTKQNYTNRKPTQPIDLLLSDSIDDCDSKQNSTSTINLSISKLKIEPNCTANNTLIHASRIEDEVGEGVEEEEEKCEVGCVRGEEIEHAENEINAIVNSTKETTETIAYDGDYINFEVSNVDDMNEYAIDGNWQAEQVRIKIRCSKYYSLGLRDKEMCHHAEGTPSDDTSYCAKLAT